MASQPEQNHLQSLKYIVDTAVTSHRNTIWEALKAWEKVIKFPQWMAALHYTEKRIGAMETEVVILAERLRELARFMEDKKDKDKAKDDDEMVIEKDVSVITTAQAKDRRARTSLELEGLDKERLPKDKILEKVLNALRDAVVDFVEKKMERVRCEQALQKWLEEGKSDETAKWVGEAVVRAKDRPIKIFQGSHSVRRLPSPFARPEAFSLMEGIPIVTLQTLKALVDTANDSHDAALHFAFDSSAHPLPADIWQEVLIHIYARLTPIEAELTLLFPRAQELAPLVGKDMSHIQAIEPVARPPEVEDLYVQVTVDDVPHLKDLVIRGVGLLREKEHQRRTYYAVIKLWIEEGWALNTI